MNRSGGDDAQMKFSVMTVDDDTFKIVPRSDVQVSVCLREEKACKSVVLRACDRGPCTAEVRLRPMKIVGS